MSQKDYIYISEAYMKRKKRISEYMCEVLRSQREIKFVFDRMKTSANSPYAKKLIVGKTHIYLASPIYGHRDYNKSVAFDNTERNRKITERLNKMFGY